jgi:type IV secretion system protein VirB8
MTDPSTEPLEPYYAEAARWSADREHELLASRRIAWIFACVLAAIALAEALALVFLVPLKTAVPYMLMVDRQTGAVQALDPLDKSRIAPDTALLRALVAQYVVAREGFDIDSLRSDYRKVSLWSAEEARTQYGTQMQAGNTASPLATLPRRALVEVRLQSVNSLGAGVALVRFATQRTDPGAPVQAAQRWSAVVRYRFSDAAMSAADRLENPLGFQVVRYRREAEVAPPPEVSPAIAPAPPASQP